MQKVLTPNEMRTLEQTYLSAEAVPSADLMVRACRTFTEVLIERFGIDRTVYFLCGPGGNGGDGYGSAALYARAGCRATVIRGCEPRTADARRMCDMALEAGVSVLESPDGLPEPDLWVDALYGIGLDRPIAGTDAEWIARANESTAPVVAVDIPSGLNGLSGIAGPSCIRADLTVTFECLKRGHLLGDGPDQSGETVVRSIGIPHELLPEDAAALVTTGDVKLPPRRRNTHKGDYGRLLIVAGSFGMAGAAAICANAAMRSGAGLTTVACPESIVPVIQVLAPCATCLPLPEREGAIAPEAAVLLREALKGRSAVAAGCGLSTRCAPEIVAEILKSGLPAVLDADALNLIAAHEDLRQELKPCHILTPHPGEAARLLGVHVSDPVTDARELHRSGAQILLKGAVSVICTDPGVFLSASGCAGMAKGGSGDALTGIAGALLASGICPEEAAYMASEIHGLAGEKAQARFGSRGMLPTDLIECIPEVVG